MAHLCQYESDLEGKLDDVGINASDSIGSPSVLTNNTNEVTPGYSQHPFDVKLLMYKKPLIEKLRQPDGTSLAKFHQPFTHYAIFNSNRYHRHLATLLDSIGTALNDEKINSTPVLAHLQTVYSDPIDINKLVQAVIVDQYPGFCERLDAFESLLSKSFYSNTLPVDTVMRRFSQMFTVQLDGAAHFNIPELKFQYSWVSLFASIVHAVCTFTKTTAMFEYCFDPTHIQELYLKALAYSDYKKSPCSGSLLALWALRNNMFLNEATNGVIKVEADALGLLRDIIDVCHMLGIHIQCNIFEDEGISEQCITILWNWIQLVDSILAAQYGTMPLVNYESCVPHLTESFKPIIVLFRYVAEVFNTSHPISITDMVSVLDIVSEYVTKLPAFDKFEIAGQSFGAAKTWVKLTKACLISVLQSILFKIKQSCEMLKLESDLELTEADIELVDGLIERCDFQSTCIVIFSFRLMSCAIKLNPEWSLEEPGPLLILRVSFSRFVSQAYHYIISHLSHMNLLGNASETFQGPEWKLQQLENNSITDLEAYLFRPMHLVDNQNDPMMANLVSIFNDLPTLLEMLWTFYKQGNEEPDLANSVMLQTQLQFLFSICLLLQTVNERKAEQEFFQPGQEWRIDAQDWKAIVEEVKNKQANYSNQVSCDTSAFTGSDFQLDGKSPWDQVENLFDNEQFQKVVESIGLDSYADNI